MADVLSRLSQSRARDVMAILDSCFSGAGGRSVLPQGARPLVRVKAPTAPERVAILSASAADQISGASPSGGGLLTEFVVEALSSGSADSDGDGQISLLELQQWVKPRVAREAQRQNRQQEPVATTARGEAGLRDFAVAWGYAPHAQ